MRLLGDRLLVKEIEEKQSKIILQKKTSENIGEVVMSNIEGIKVGDKVVYPMFAGIKVPDVGLILNNFEIIAIIEVSE